MATEFPQLGRSFEGRYRLTGILGQGGFARIYLAEETELERRVALKILDPRLSQDERRAKITIERFRREARLVAGLSDPHTITLYEHGRTDDGLLYLVFEYVDGESLNAVIDRSDGVEPMRVAKIIRQTLMSLHEAHNKGVLHRDIKPGNIMLYEHMGRSDRVKVLDFGIAKAVLSDDDGTTAKDLTKADAIIGTPRYMAPEQFRDIEPKPASDIYSLGLVAYELLVAEKAIHGDSLANIIAEHVSGDPVEIPAGSGVPESLRAIVNGMTVPELRDRYSNAQEILEDLDELDEDELRDPETEAPTVVATPTEEPPPTGEMSGASEEATREGSQRVNVAEGITMLVGTAMVVAVGFYMLSPEALDSGTPRSTPSSSTTASDQTSTNKIRVETQPTDASVAINDVFVGESPVEVRRRSIRFPAVVTATTDDGHTGRISLERPRSSVTLELVRPAPEGPGGSSNGSSAEQTSADSKAPTRPTDDDSPTEDPSAHPGEPKDPSGSDDGPPDPSNGSDDREKPEESVPTASSDSDRAESGSGASETGGQEAAPSDRKSDSSSEENPNSESAGSAEGSTFFDLTEAEEE